MLGIVAASMLLAAEPAEPPPAGQFELGLGLGFAYDVIGFQLGVRVGKFDAFVGLSPFTFLAHTINGGLRFIATNDPGWSFMASLQGGLLWSPPDDPSGDRTYVLSAIFGARRRFASGWFTQLGIGPAVVWGECHPNRVGEGNTCESLRFVQPAADLDLGFGYAF